MSRDTCWDINLNCHMVIVIATKEHRYADYPITDILQMMGRACLPQHDDTGRCVLTIKKDNAKLSGMEFQCNIILNFESKLLACNSKKLDKLCNM